MELINIQVSSNKVTTLCYEYKDRQYLFDSDICVNGWTISRAIAIKGPSSSCYKYDYRNYLEFIITDPNGDQKIKTWFHNKGDNELKSYWAEYNLSEAIKFYIENSPIFNCKNWVDYEDSLIIKDISSIIEDETSNSSAIERIIDLLQSKKTKL